MAGTSIASGNSLASPKNAGRIRVCNASNIGAISLGENAIGYVSTAGGVSTKGVVLVGGSSSYPITWSTASKDGVAFYTKSTATSGYGYGCRFDHKVAGAAGGGAAVRAKGSIVGVAADDVYGGEFTGELSSTAGSSTKEGGTIAALSAVTSIQIAPPDHAWVYGVVARSDVLTGLDSTGAKCAAYYATEDAGVGTGFDRLFSIRKAIATDTPASNLVSTHADHAADHLVKIGIVNPSTYAVTDMWLLATSEHA